MRGPTSVPVRRVFAELWAASPIDTWRSKVRSAGCSANSANKGFKCELTFFFTCRCGATVPQCKVQTSVLGHKATCALWSLWRACMQACCSCRVLLRSVLQALPPLLPSQHSSAAAGPVNALGTAALLSPSCLLYCRSRWIQTCLTVCCRGDCRNCCCLGCTCCAVTRTATECTAPRWQSDSP